MFPSDENMNILLMNISETLEPGFVPGLVSCCHFVLCLGSSLELKPGPGAGPGDSSERIMRP